MSNHVIYDRIWESQKLAACSLKAALAYPWIYLVADDWGRFEYAPRIIWGKCFGARTDVKSSEVQGWLTEYERVGLLVNYSAAGRRLGFWARFTGKPRSRRRPSRLPAPKAGAAKKGLAQESWSKALPVVRQPVSLGREGEGDREKEMGRREGSAKPDASHPVPPPRLSRGEAMSRHTAEEIDRLACALAEKTAAFAGYTPSQYVERASYIEPGNGHPAASFANPRARGISEAWGQATLAKLRSLVAEAQRPVPL